MNEPSAPSLRVRLEEIDTKAAQLQAQIAALAVSRREIVEQLKRVVYPVLTLPGEITAEIFVQYTHHVHANISAPFLLASICRNWRTTALGLEKLWTKIVIHIFHNPECLELVKLQLRLCLERAGKHSLLDIHITADSGMEEILSLVAPSAGRWSTFDVSPIAPTLRLYHLHGCMPHLRALTLMNGTGDWDSGLSDSTVFMKAPLLREVDLFDVDASMVALPWEQLTTLRFGVSLPVNSEDCFEILSQARNLQILDLQIPENPLPDGLEDALHFEHLHTLTLGWSRFNSDAAVSFIDLLTVPALVRFTTDIGHSENDAGTSAIVEMLERSDRPHLRSLTLNNDGAADLAAIHNIIALSPTIDKVSVTGVSWDMLEPLFLVLEHGGMHRGPASPYKIRELHVEPVAGRIRYDLIQRYIAARGLDASARSDDSDSLRRFSFSVPEYGPLDWHHSEDTAASAVKSLRHAAASSDGPEISITGRENVFVIQSDTRPPPVYTLWEALIRCT
ncbi:hypothetical protein C8F01DRAFT_1144415 [Mycena amicta]|nr:hypothetical protein C8F01DRAFT_1144415 [Mycena amicta]